MSFQVKDLQAKIHELTKEVENKDVKLKESESTISGLQFSNSQMESKIAHMQEQMEFWDEESSKMKERLQASSVRIDEQEKELRRLRKQATDLDGANEQANAARMEIEVKGGGEDQRGG
mmetsp:Transcript_24064/g.78285  ORF Transcript_24064/g.78285 Transcript_24064/m.78285 type:complete len:119 (-) Transcript_24064:848-1204(-)